MAEDDGDGAPVEPTVSLAQIKDAVREVLAEMPGVGALPENDTDPDGDPLDAPVYSIRQAERYAQEKVEEAMNYLTANAKPTKARTAPKSSKGEDDDGDEGSGGSSTAKGKAAEKPPTPPQQTAPAWQAKLRKIMVGADD